MSDACKVSVIIPCFNHGQFLPEAVASVVGIGQSDVELIVVDDGSTDDCTQREMDRLAASGIRVIRQQNHGLATARNVGIAASVGEYILPLDADNRVRAAYVQHGIRILASDPRIGVVYGDAEYIGIRSGRWRVGQFDAARLMDSNYIDACAIFRRQVWVENGGYDSTMPVQGAEDWDLWLGALERGWEFAYVPEVLFSYRVAQESMLTRIRGFEEPLYLFLAKKHGPLYRREWQSLLAERRSVRLLARRLASLVLSNLDVRSAQR